MVERSVIECDGCGDDLSHFKLHKRRYCLVLKSGYMMPPKDHEGPLGGEPPLDREHHFCEVRCLDQWILKQPKITT